MGLLGRKLVRRNCCMRFRGRGISHSDVTAVMGGIAFEQLSTDRAALKGVKAEPSTKKVGITAKGG